MKTIAVTSVFDCMSGNSGLTEEFIYTKLATKGTLYEVLSSSTTGMTRLGFIPMCILDNDRTLRVFEGKHGILVARNGRAGQMTYLKPGNYTINDHAYILSVRDDFKKVTNISTPDDERRFLLWFICTFQSRVYEFALKTDNATWNKTDFLTMSVGIPKAEEIAEIAKLYEDCLNIMDEAQEMSEKITELKSKSINTSDIASKGELPISKVLGYESRNDSLSEEGIYHHLPDKDDKEPIQVLSGSAKNFLYGKVSSATSGIHILDKKNGLHVVSRGRAGNITFLPMGRYATNTNAFLFYMLPELMIEAGITNAEQEVTYLKFLRIYLQPIFYGACSESDLSVFPLTELMKSLTVPLFIYCEGMKHMVEEYDMLDNYEKHLDNISDRLDNLLQKQIVLS